MYLKKKAILISAVSTITSTFLWTQFIWAFGIPTYIPSEKNSPINPVRNNISNICALVLSNISNGVNLQKTSRNNFGRFPTEVFLDTLKSALEPFKIPLQYIIESAGSTYSAQMQGYIDDLKRQAEEAEREAERSMRDAEDKRKVVASSVDMISTLTLAQKRAGAKMIPISFIDNMFRIYKI